MSSTTQGAQRSLRYLLSGTPYSGISDNYLYIHLSTTDIATDGSGATTPVGNYTMVYALRSADFWNITDDDVISNAVEFDFISNDNYGASSNWGTLKEIFISIDGGVSASSIQYHQALIPNIPVNTGTRVVVPVGSLTIKRDSSSYQTV